VKKCTYCGRENEDQNTRCTGCETELSQPAECSVPEPLQAVRWFKIYTGVLAFCYLACAGYGVLLLDDPAERVLGIALQVISIPLLIACSLPLLLRPRPWLWTYDLVIICLGMTSACFLIFAIPLLLAWLKPQTKSYFGKT